MRISALRVDYMRKRRGFRRFTVPQAAYRDMPSLFLYLLLTMLALHTAAPSTETKEIAVPAPSDIKDLSAEGSGVNLYGLLSPGAAGALGPLGALGLNPALGPQSVQPLAGALGLNPALGPQAVPPLGGVNPLLSNLLLSTMLSNPLLYGAGVPPQNHQLGQGHNPLLAFLLSQYGRYLPYGLGGYGLYGFSASNNVHNTKPFGNYKYEQRS